MRSASKVMAHKCRFCTQNLRPNLIKRFPANISVSVSCACTKMCFGYSVINKSFLNFLLIIFCYFFNIFKLLLQSFSALSEASKILLSILKNSFIYTFSNNQYFQNRVFYKIFRFCFYHALNILFP